MKAPKHLFIAVAAYVVALYLASFVPSEGQFVAIAVLLGGYAFALERYLRMNK